MTCWGILKDGGQMLLGDPKEMALAFDRDAPADALRAVFPAERLWETFSEIVVYEGGFAVFRGIVDEQNTRLGPEGVWIELVCRSLEALLLDNEACPDPIRSPSLKALSTRLLEPLGFTRIEGGDKAAPGMLEIEKGMSCWQVLSAFCAGVLGTVPYIDPDGVLHCEGYKEEEVVLSDVIWAEISHKPCREISEVYKQSFGGGYDTPYRQPGAIAQRRRYVSIDSGTNPKELLQKSQAESRSVTLECAGILWPLRGKTVSVELPKLGKLTKCPVISARCCRDGRGLRTRLTLEGGQAACG